MSRTAAGRRIRLLAIFVGTAVDILGSLLASTLLTVAAGILGGPEVFSEPPAGLVFAGLMLLGCIFTVLGACVAGLIARQREVVHGLGVAVLSGAIGLSLDTGEMPRWFPLVALLAGLAAGAGGGWLAGWARRGDSPAAAASEPPAVETTHPPRTMNFRAGIGVLLIAVIGLLSIGFFRAAGEQPRAQQPRVEISVDRIYLAPINAAPDLIDRLKNYYRVQLGLEIEVLPTVQPDPASFDSAREQMIAEELVATLKDRFGSLTQDGRAVVIGITSWDIYTRSQNWRFAFGLRRNPYAVVSYARMHLPATRRGAPDETLVFPRLRKMVTRYLGVLAFRLEMNTDRRSIMYQDVLGVDDLDRIEEDLATDGFPGRSSR
jgi:predicted Zn-dependent protease